MKMGEIMGSRVFVFVVLCKTDEYQLQQYIINFKGAQCTPPCRRGLLQQCYWPHLSFRLL